MLIGNTDWARRKGVWLRHTSNRYPAVAALSGVEAIAQAYGWTKRQELLAIAGSGQTTRTPCWLECMNGRANKIKMGTRRTQATLAYAGAVSSQFEPTAADGDSESCSEQAQSKQKTTTAVVGSVCNMLSGDWVGVKVHCCSVVEA